MSGANAGTGAVISARPATAGRLSRLMFRHEVLRGYTMLAPALVIMVLAILLPFVLMIVMSFWDQVGFDFDTTPTLQNYREIAEKPIYSALLLRSLWVSGIATLATVLVCYPMAYFVAFHVHRHKMLWLIIITLPFWTSYLMRIFSWKVILGYEGVINSGLMSIGLIDAPLDFLIYSPGAVTLTLAHTWAAFALLPIYVSLEKIDRSVLEAAADLGDSPLVRFFRITLPLSMPGVIAAVFLMFIPTVGDYVTPTLVGGPDGAMIGNLLQVQFGGVNNWPMGAAIAVVMVLAIAVVGLCFLALTALFRRWAT
ncbi:MAG: ABC transporter permease [Rhodobacterales bacterium]|nr:ABC transporter permease [Rhodobacterales bacterium]